MNRRSVSLAFPTNRSLRRWLLTTLVGVLLSGCLGVGGGTREGPRIFDLDLEAGPELSPTRTQQLLIPVPRAGQSLATERIAVRPQPGELRYYAGASWSDAAPQLVQQVVLEAFEDSAAFSAVGRVGAGLRGGRQLMLDLRRFESVYRDGRPHATVELQATLLDGDTGNALGSRRLQSSRPAAGTEIPVVIDAFNEATDEVVGELVRWVHQLAGEQPDGAQALLPSPPGEGQG